MHEKGHDRPEEEDTIEEGRARHIRQSDKADRAIRS